MSKGAQTRKRQEPLLTSPSHMSNRRPSPRWTLSRRGSLQFMRVSGKPEGRPCSFLLDSGSAKSLVNPPAFPDLCNKFRTGPPSAKLLPAEGRKVKVKGKTSLKVSLGKETWKVQFIMCPELVWDAILGVDYLRNTKAVLNFAEGTFATQQYKETSPVRSPPKKDADEICSDLFEAAGIPINNLDELCFQLTQITGSERKELRSLLSKNPTNSHGKERNSGEQI